LRVARQAAGDKVKVKVVRDGKTIEETVLLTKRP